MRSFFLSLLALSFSSLVYSQALRPNSESLFFAPTSASQKDSLPLILTNVQSYPVSIKAIKLFDFYGQFPFETSLDTGLLAAGDSIEGWVYFQPQHNVFHNSELLIITDAPAGDLSIDLRGQGVYDQNYYAISRNLSQNELKAALKTKLAQNYRNLGYRGARDQMFLQVDNQRTNGLGANENTLECIYTGTQVAGYNSRSQAQNQGFNTEHVFPQGFFNQSEPMRADLFHLFPTTATSNSMRSNLPFGEVSNALWQQGGSRQGSSRFEPRDEYKGVIARAMFYFVIRYQDYNNFLRGQEAILRQWHRDFPPDERERQRNEAIAALQQNRNPFIDYPQLVDRIHSISGNSVEPQNKSLEWSRQVVDLGSVASGRPYNFTWALVNTGNTEVAIRNLGLSDPLLSWENISGTDTVLAPGEALSLNIALGQGPIGPFSATLHLETDVVGAESLDIPIMANLITNLPSVPFSTKWRVYPQPAKDVLYLEQVGNPTALSLKLFDLAGRLKRDVETSIPRNEERLSLAGLPSGVYLLKVKGQASQLIRVE